MTAPGSGAGIDITRPNMARVYDYWLGGKDNFAADRALAEQVLDPVRGYPGLRQLVRSNRAFVVAVTAWAARSGISQFIDLGCGLPTRPAVHEAARAARPDARVAYVDWDPLVLSHIRALAGEGLAAAGGDLTDPDAVLASPELTAVTDMEQPVCVILAAVLHFLPAGQAGAVTAGWARRLAPGSVLAVSCAHYEDEALNERIRAMYGAGTWVNHDRDAVRSFLAGLDIVPPGVVTAQRWRPPDGVAAILRRPGDPPCPGPSAEAYVLAGAGRVPG